MVGGWKKGWGKKAFTFAVFPRSAPHVNARLIANGKSQLSLKQSILGILSMVNQVLIYSGSAFIAFWGVAHLFPTRSVVSGFGEVSADNKRIIAIKWIVEGIAQILSDQ